jgi:hypothetical protein
MIRSLKFFSLTLVCGVLIAPSFACAWSVIGHQVVSRIAEQNVSSVTRKKMQQILAGESLDDASIWPDNVKDSSKWSHTKSYHYKNIPSGTNYFSDLQSLTESKRKRGDLILALLRAEDVLRAPKSTAEQRKNALRFFIHFFADLHQPLHAGYIDDSGGNAVGLTWYGLKTNLHSLWDRHLVISYLKNTFPDNPKTPLTEIVSSLKKPSKKTIAQWTSGFYIDWLNESLTIRDSTYQNLKSINDIYYQTHIGTITTQLSKAGYRMAFVLENILNPQALPSTENQSLRKKILSILGPETTDFGINLDSKTAKSRESGDLDPEEEWIHDCHHNE